MVALTRYFSNGQRTTGPDKGGKGLAVRQGDFVEVEDKVLGLVEDLVSLGDTRR
jgi:hypothetical protein